MVKGKSVNLFLIDGEVTGRIKCTLANWTGVVYKIPRSLLAESKSIAALQQSAIYMLFGTNDNNEPLVYIGQAGVRKNEDGALRCLMEHDTDGDKDFWNEAIVLTTSNDSFGPTDLNYLENRYFNLALETKRYKLFNNAEPNKGNVTEEKVSELEGYIEFSNLPIGLLGKKFLTPIDETTEDLSKVDRRLYLSQRVGVEDIKGFARETNEGFLLLKGSKVSRKWAPKLSEVLKSKRDAVPKDKNNCILEDIMFTSPSAAAMFLTGQSTNGLIAWKTKKGITLKEHRYKSNFKKLQK
ncbi:GIY-YIG nuclease family protein [Veillonella agrestimuris]|uniref:GIY-YIG nuclease family protein n=1 Tax=Veillonella agrestimuris TaxID=2941340 RepID=UPI00204180A2|nr:GIY-YIG nuclease family protein [Veillonella agrestimuris]